MNCDIDGTSAGTQLCETISLCGLHHVIIKRLCVVIVSNECLSLSGDMENQVEMEEKTRLINQVLELQHTLEGNKSLTHTQNLIFSLG